MNTDPNAPDEFARLLETPETVPGASELADELEAEAAHLRTQIEVTTIVRVRERCDGKIIGDPATYTVRRLGYAGAAKRRRVVETLARRALCDLMDLHLDKRR